MKSLITRQLIGLALWALLAGGFAPLLPQQQAQSQATQTQASTPAQNAGRLAPTLESEARDKTQKPDEVLKAMNVQPGQVIVDIGAGKGYFTRRFAAAVGSTGQAIGVEIDPANVRAMMADAKRYGLTNYEARL